MLRPASLLCAILFVTACAGRSAPGSARPTHDGRSDLAAARQQLAIGRHHEAVRLYERALAGRLGARERREALFGAVALRLGPDPAIRDLARARGLLRELGMLDRTHPEGTGARLLLTLLDELEAVRARAASLEALIHERAVEAGASRDESDARIAQLTGELQTLRRELRNARAELKTVRGELEKKEEALRKVADTLLAGSRPR